MPAGQSFYLGQGFPHQMPPRCLNNSVEVELLGGSVRIDWDGDKVHTGRDVFLTGPAEYVFTAEL